MSNPRQLNPEPAATQASAAPLRWAFPMPSEEREDAKDREERWGAWAEALPDSWAVPMDPDRTEEPEGVGLSIFEADMNFDGAMLVRLDDTMLLQVLGTMSHATTKEICEALFADEHITSSVPAVRGRLN